MTAGQRDTARRPPVAIVTGAAGLIGSAVCEVLSSAGSEVVAIDAKPTEVANVVSVVADVCDRAGLDGVARDIDARYGYADYLIHAAALTGRSPLLPLDVTLTDIDLEAWDRVLRVNLTAALACVQSFIGLLRRSDSARILFFGSIQGAVPTLGSGAYSVSKTGLIGLTRQLAAELAVEGIRVNMISPGPVANRPTRAQGPGLPETHRLTPLGRRASPMEVAGAVHHLMSDAFDYMTGMDVHLDGGEHLRPRYSPPPVSS